MSLMSIFNKGKNPSTSIRIKGEGVVFKGRVEGAPTDLSDKKVKTFLETRVSDITVSAKQETPDDERSITVKRDLSGKLVAQLWEGAETEEAAKPEGAQLNK